MTSLSFHHSYSPSLHQGMPCSPEQSSEFSAVKLSGERPFDMHRYRAIFPTLWAGFLKAHFRNAVQVAAFFDTDARTAEHWLNGTNAPSGRFVARAVTAFPQAAQMLRTE